MDIDENGNFRYVQWNYRILCNFLNYVDFKVFKFIDDIVFRMLRKYNMLIYICIDEVRFIVVVELYRVIFDQQEGYGMFEDKVYVRGVFDNFMYQVLGVNNFCGG